MVKNLPTNTVDPDSNCALEKEVATHHSRFLPGKSHGQGSMVGYSPWDCKESDKT